MTSITTQTPLHNALNAWIARLGCAHVPDGNWLQAHAAMLFSPDIWIQVTNTDATPEAVREAYNELSESDLYGDHPGINEGTGQLPMWMNHFIHQAMVEGREAVLIGNIHTETFEQVLHSLALVNGGVMLYALAETWTAWALWGAYATIAIVGEDQERFAQVAQRLAGASWTKYRTWSNQTLVIRSSFNAVDGFKEVIRIQTEQDGETTTVSTWYGRIYCELDTGIETEERIAETISVYRIGQGKSQLTKVSILHPIDQLTTEVKTFKLD